MGQELEALAQRVHEANKKWWQNPEDGSTIERNNDQMLMLVLSELAEAMEGDRKNLKDDKLPHREMFEVELADALIRLLDLAGAYNIPLSEWKGIGFTYSPNRAANLMMLSRVVCYPFSTKAALATTVQMSIYGVIALGAHENIDLWGAFEEKMGYNATRRDHTHEARLEANGKKY